MALTAEHVDLDPPPRGGLVVRMSALRGSTYLDVATDTGIATIRVDAEPVDPSLARTALPMRRIASVRIDVSPEGTRCVARGIAHRLPRDYPVTASTALALVRLGVPAVVTDRGRD